VRNLHKTIITFDSNGGWRRTLLCSELKSVYTEVIPVDAPALLRHVLKAPRYPNISVAAGGCLPGNLCTSRPHTRGWASALRWFARDTTGAGRSAT